MFLICGSLQQKLIVLEASNTTHVVDIESDDFRERWLIKYEWIFHTYKDWEQKLVRIWKLFLINYILLRHSLLYN